MAALPRAQTIIAGVEASRLAYRLLRARKMKSITMRIVLVKGLSTYNSANVFLVHLAEGLIRRGHEPIVVDGLRDDFDAQLKRISEDVTDFSFSFGLFGEYRSPSGSSISDIIGAPHVIQYIDYPLSHALRLEKTPRSSAILVINESHVAAIHSVYGRDHFAFVGFSPHGAVGPVIPAQTSAAFAAERPIPILFSGTFQEPGPPTWATFPPELPALFDEAYEKALSCEWIAALDAVREASIARGVDPDAPDFLDVRKAATFIHEQVRTYRRFQLLQTAAAVGLPICVLGRIDDSLLSRFKNITYGGEADLDKTAALMQSSRMVLNTNANFGGGSHERPLTAMLAGAVAVSDFSTFYSNNFRENEGIILYRWMALEEGMHRVGALLEQPDAAHAIAMAGQARVSAQHRWDNRVDAIIAAAAAARDRMQTGT